jgi:glycerol-1-phosphatase
VISEGSVRLSGDGDRYDGLRALLTAAWSADHGAGEVVDATESLARLGFDPSADAGTA